jgi:hypothetical protein
MTDGDFYLVSADGVETYVVYAQNGSTVSDAAELSSILEADARNRAGFGSMVSSALEFAGKVESAKQASEAKCIQYIGDDGDPGCTDRQSCLVSCFSVPQCEIVVQSDGFLEAMMDWDFKRKEFASGLADFSQGIEEVQSDPSAIDGKIDVLSKLSALAKNMSQNEIFLEKEEAGCTGKNATRRCYEYCPKIDYSQALIAAQSQSLESLKSTLSDVLRQQSRASAMLEKGAENNAYLSTRGRDYEEFRLRMKNDIRNLQSKSNELRASLNDTTLPGMIGGLENISSLAANYSSGGYYRKALFLRPQFGLLFNQTSDRINSGIALVSSFKAGLLAAEAKVNSSRWLIGNESSDAFLSNISKLRENFTLPTTYQAIYGANATLFQIGQALDAEIAAKAVQAGSAPSMPSPPSGPSMIGPAEFAIVAFIALAALAVLVAIVIAAKRIPKK